MSDNCLNNPAPEHWKNWQLAVSKQLERKPCIFLIFSSFICSDLSLAFTKENIQVNAALFW